MRVLLMAGVAVAVTLAARVDANHATPVSVARDPDGAKLYAATCATCHMPDGLGRDTIYPPLVGSEWVTGKEARLIRVILHGLTGPIEVQGEPFDGLMPPWGITLKDDEIAAIATYVRASWGHKAAPVTTASVTRYRLSDSARKTPWTARELQALDR